MVVCIMFTWKYKMGLLLHVIDQTVQSSVLLSMIGAIILSININVGLNIYQY